SSRRSCGKSPTARCGRPAPSSAPSGPSALPNRKGRRTGPESNRCSATEDRDVSRRDWLCSVVAWDGFFPLLVAGAPAMLPVALPKGVLAGLTVFLAPIVAALLRAHQG